MPTVWHRCPAFATQYNGCCSSRTHCLTGTLFGMVAAGMPGWYLLSIMWVMPCMYLRPVLVACAFAWLCHGHRGGCCLLCTAKPLSDAAWPVPVERLSDTQPEALVLWPAPAGSCSPDYKWWPFTCRGVFETEAEAEDFALNGNERLWGSGGVQRGPPPSLVQTTPSATTSLRCRPPG